MRDKKNEPTGIRCETSEMSRMTRERISDKFKKGVTSGMDETGERCGGRWFGDERQLETQTLSPPQSTERLSAGG